MPNTAQVWSRKMLNGLVALHYIRKKGVCIGQNGAQSPWLRYLKWMVHFQVKKIVLTHSTRQQKISNFFVSIHSIICTRQYSLAIWSHVGLAEQSFVLGGRQDEENWKLQFGWHWKANRYRSSIETSVWFGRVREQHLLVRLECQELGNMQQIHMQRPESSCQRSQSLWSVESNL